MTDAARRETFEETGHAVDDLQLYQVYTWDDRRLLWVVYKARLGHGQFTPNGETRELLFYSRQNPPPRGALCSRAPGSQRSARRPPAADMSFADPRGRRLRVL